MSCDWLRTADEPVQIFQIWYPVFFLKYAKFTNDVVQNLAVIREILFIL